MARMGKYTKAFTVKDLSEFSGWPDRLGTDDPYLFLQENYVVTRNIFLDEDVVFDNVTPEWREFYEKYLHFSVPADLISTKETQS
jgi:hypothetical protein